MNVILDINNINKFGIHFMDTVRNTVMENSNFIRILYSNELFALNGIYIYFTLNNAKVDRYFSKHKCTFNYSENQDVINKIISLESYILDIVGIKKKPLFNIRDQISSGFIKLFANDYMTCGDNTFILKISGLWETHKEIGMTFKFIDSPNH